MRIGRYEIVNELGRGAMGIVYRADDPVIGRTVAIKTIKLGDITDPQEHQRLRDRLFREARSAGILSHPNIVTVFDIGEQGETAYIAMEFVSGNTLEPMMRSGAEKHVILSVIYETAAALDYAHSKGIVHRDVKPANIMINENGAVKITDFGIAKILSQQVTQADLVLGTPSYMSPEQIEAKSLDGRSDQFALAVIAYEMLTGEKPFAADSLPSLLFKIVKEDQLAAHHLNPTLGLETGAVLEKALSKKSDGRYATCSEFAQALTDSLNLHPAWRPLMRGAASSMATIFEPAPEFTRLDTTLGSPPSPDLPADMSEAPTHPVAPPLPPPQPPPPPPVAPPAPQAASPETPRVAPPVTLPPVQPARTEIPSTPWERRDVPAPPPSVSIKNLVMAVLVIVLAVGAWYAFRTFTSSGSKQIATADPPAAPPVAPPEKKDDTAPKGDPPKGGVPVVDPQPTGGSTQPAGPVPSSDPKAPGTTKPGADTRLVFVEIESDPPGAKVSIDPGTEAATGCNTPCPMQLPPGRHVVVVSLAGYRDTSRIFVLPQESQWKIKLERQSGLLSIRSTPGEAQILINGQAHSQATPAIVTLPVGKYKIGLRKQGFVAWDEEIEVRDQVNSTISVTLPPNG